MRTITARLDRLEARAPVRAGPAPHVLSDAEIEAHVRALIDAGLLWCDESGVWRNRYAADDEPDAHGYTPTERAGMIAELLNRITKEGESNV